MKRATWLGLAALAAWPAHAGDALSSFFSGQRDVFFHVLLEKTNGTDIRARNMPRETIAKAEAEGKQVRPTRDTQYVESYWALLSDGTFKTFEFYNYGKSPPQGVALTYAELGRLFAPLPPLTKWKREADFSLGDTHFSVRAITAGTSAGAGKKGEIEFGWLEEGKPVYFYYCLPIAK